MGQSWGSALVRVALGATGGVSATEECGGVPGRGGTWWGREWHRAWEGAGTESPTQGCLVLPQRLSRG